MKRIAVQLDLGDADPFSADTEGNTIQVSVDLNVEDFLFSPILMQRAAEYLLESARLSLDQDSKTGEAYFCICFEPGLTCLRFPVNDIWIDEEADGETETAVRSWAQRLEEAARQTHKLADDIRDRSSTPTRQGRP